MATKTIPLSLLTGACLRQLEIVKREWPDGIPLTEESCARSKELELDCYWLADQLLTDSDRDEYHRIARDADDEHFRILRSYLSEYRRLWVSALDDFDLVTASYRSEYNVVTASSSAGYRSAWVSAMDEFNRTTKSSWAEYVRAKEATCEDYKRARITTLLSVLLDAEWIDRRIIKEAAILP
jgi:hypothetical protein